MVKNNLTNKLGMEEPVEGSSQLTYGLEESSSPQGGVYGLLRNMPQPVKYGAFAISLLGMLVSSYGCGTSGIGKVNGVEVTNGNKQEKNWCQKNPYQCAGAITFGAVAIGTAAWAINEANDNGGGGSSSSSSTDDSTSDDADQGQH